MELIAWGIFLVLVCLLLAFDLGVLNKNEHVISTKEAIFTTILWIALALVFNVVVYFAYEHNWFDLLAHSPDIKTGNEAALKFFTGYLIEKALSLDNIFVIAMLFTYFKIPNIYQHRVLFWGILGALFFRAVMIVLGSALVVKFSWIMYVFGALLVFSALKMLFGKEEEFDAEKSKVIRVIRKFYPVSTELDGHNFFTIKNGVKMVTPLFVVLMVIETTDIMFAVDSIPAIFVITTDPFIVFTSNVFAILGLRSLYFVLASFMDKFKYLKYSLVVLLLFIGIKMLLLEVYHLPVSVSLGIIVLILTGGVVASVLSDKRNA
ncbi:MAG: Inner membrane protein alx [Bacteroidetes bacterium ADurb.Bin217]|nr:MAG: Inner membrane protein alx [Bacteroidetes bacterium ADurb.Bin217]